MNFAQKVAYYTSPAGKLRLLVHLPNLIRLHWRLLVDKRVSLVPKVILLAGLAYFVIPFDLIPEFPLVVLGWTDDIVVVAMAAKIFVAMAPRHVVEEHVRLIDGSA